MASNEVCSASTTQTTRRGFTFHEQIDNIGLIHMNGRVYDPNVGRFMSTDPLIACIPNES